MSAGNRTQSLLLVSLMIFASWVPATAEDGQTQSTEGPTIYAYDLDGFVAEDDGRPYLFAGDEDELIFSATRHLKQEWADDGYPGLVMPFEESSSSRTSGRACENAWTTGQTGTVQTTGGQIQVSAMHVTANSVILIENGQSVSSTTLNNIGSTWETTIYPTNTNYFGNAPDVDNNCQIEIVIYAIDGGANIGGYFMPGMSSVREIIYVDIDDLSWRNTILLTNLSTCYTMLEIHLSMLGLTKEMPTWQPSSVLEHRTPSSVTPISGQPTLVHPYAGGTSDWPTTVLDSCSCSSLQIT